MWTATSGVRRFEQSLLNGGTLFFMTNSFFRIAALVLLAVLCAEAGYLIYAQQQGLDVQGFSFGPQQNQNKASKKDPSRFDSSRFTPDSIPLRHTSPPIPDKLYFAGDQVPLYLPHVREKLEHELLSNTYYHSRTLGYIKRAHRWLPKMDSMLQVEGLDTDYKYISVIESDLSPVRSPAGAAGFWQLMPATARERDLIVGTYVDQRYDVVEATKASAAYLKHNYDYFGNHLLTAASFNCGRRCIQNYIHREKTASYFELHLNRETERYVYRILAIKLILENPERYGFYVPESELYPPYNDYEVEVDTTVHSWLRFADFFGIPSKILYRRNPWIHDNHLPNRSRTTYRVRLPSQIMRDTTLMIDTASDVAGFQDLTPVHLRPRPEFSGTYRVVEGDRLEHLAVKFGTTVSRLYRANHLKRYRLRAGQQLRVPESAS